MIDALFLLEEDGYYFIDILEPNIYYGPFETLEEAFIEFENWLFGGYVESWEIDGTIGINN